MVMMTFIVVNPAFAHKNHRRYSSLIIDPFITHHALLEDEQRLNFFYFKNRALNNRISNGVNIELAYALSNSLGFEMFIPILSSDEEDSNFRGLGDIEVQPLKLSFYPRKNMVMTGVLSTVLPTGDESKGFAKSGASILARLYSDVILGDFVVQTNLSFGRMLGGKSGNTFEYNLFVSRPIFKSQPALFAVVEFNGGLNVTGRENSENVLYVTPGLKLTYNGWHLGAGVQFPLADSRMADRVALLQWGFHFGW